MSRRNSFNVKDKIRSAEEIAEKQLKDAGLWEEGLSNAEKQQLLDCIADSRNLAQAEETKRQNRISEQQNSVSGISGPKRTLVSSLEDDGEPVITYQSPSKLCPKHQPPKVVTDISTIKDVQINSSQSEDENTKRISNIPKDISNIKQIKSLFTNSSVTVKYTSEPTKESEGDSNEVLMTETDDETTNKDSDSLFVKKKDINCSKSAINKDRESTYEVVELDNTPSQKHVPDANADPLAENYSSNVNENVNSKGEEVLEHISSESLSQNILNPTSPTNCVNQTKTSNNNAIPESNIHDARSSINTNNRKIIVFNPFHSGSKIENPLKRKKDLLSEKSEAAYLKSSYESDSECVERIYALITDWRIALGNYQRSLGIHSKWGLPIIVGHQGHNGLVKKSYTNQLLKSRHTASIVYTSDVSSASDSHISDESDDDWEIFSKKKDKNSKKVVKRDSKLSRACRSSNMRGGYSSTKVPEETDLISIKEVPMDTDGPRSIETPSCSGISRNKVDKTVMNKEASSDGNSDPLIHDNSESISNIQTSFYSKNSARKSFQLSKSPSECSTNQNSQSPDLFDSQSTESFSQKNNEVIKESQEFEIPIESSEDVVCTEETVNRSSIKRKFVSNPLNMPPLKKHLRGKETNFIEVIQSDNTNPKDSSNKAYKSSVHDSMEVCLEETGGNVSVGVSRFQKLKEGDQGQIKPANEDTSRQYLTQHKDSEADLRASLTKVKTVECPLCQKDYLATEIEVHASECNGPEETIELRNQKSLQGKRVPNAPQNQTPSQENVPEEVEYLETHKKGQKFGSRRGK